MSTRRSAEGRWRAPARGHGPARWAALVLLALALTVMHLAVATNAHASAVPPAGAAHPVAALVHAQPPAAQASSTDVQPHACHGCAEGHSAQGMAHLCSAVLGAVLLAAGVRWAHRRLPVLDQVVGGRGAGRPLLVPALVANPPWTHPCLERLCVRRV